MRASNLHLPHVPAWPHIPAWRLPTARMSDLGLVAIVAIVAALIAGAVSVATTHPEYLTRVATYPAAGF